MRSVTLVIPGLLPAPEGTAQAQLPPVPGLRRMLARADRVTAAVDYPGVLADRFGLDKPAAGDWPAAVWSYLDDTGKVPAAACMRADPVHLAPGRDGLVLLDSSMFEITSDEASGLAAAIQPLLNDYAAKLETPAPARWYLQLQSPPELRTTPLFEVTGRDVGPHLPHGTGQRDWRRLFNEIQMVLHEHPVNRARDASGALTINSVWFWGLGIMPAAGRGRAGAVFADEPIARGLARAHAMTVRPLPGGADEVLQGDNPAADCLVVIERGWRFSHYRDAAGWLDYIIWLERNWMAPLLTALTRGRLQSITILMPGQGYRLQRWHLWRFWRRPVAMIT